MNREKQLTRLRAEAETLNARTVQLSETLRAAELESLSFKGMLRGFFSIDDRLAEKELKARIAVLENQAALYQSRIAALEDGPETSPPPTPEMVVSVGEAALERLEAVEKEIHEMEWHGTGSFGRQSFGRIKKQRLAQEDTAALLPFLNLFYAGFTQLTGETADLPTLLDWYFQGLSVSVAAFDGTDDAREAIAFGQKRLAEDLKTLSSL